MLDFTRLLARGLLIHFPDPNAYCYRLAWQFGKHMIYRMISIALFPTVVLKGTEHALLPNQRKSNWQQMRG
jgi:hypothetical protein